MAEVYCWDEIRVVSFLDKRHCEADLRRLWHSLEQTIEFHFLGDTHNTPLHFVFHSDVSNFTKAYYEINTHDEN